MEKRWEKESGSTLWDRWAGVQFMKTVTISPRAKTVTTLLQRATRGGLILRSPDGDEFILAEIDDFDREIELTRKQRVNEIP